MKNLRLCLIIFLTVSSLTVFLQLGNPTPNQISELRQTVFASSSREYCISGVCFPQPNLNDDFTKWGKENKLSITPFENSTGELSFEMKGQTEESAAGFKSPDLEFTGANVTLVVGNVTKSANDGDPRDHQITLVLNITGQDGKPHYLRFVNGYLTINGWKDGNYYTNISPNSALALDFGKIPISQGGYKSLNNIHVVVQNATTIDSFIFSLTPQQS